MNVKPSVEFPSNDFQALLRETRVDAAELKLEVKLRGNADAPLSPPTQQHITNVYRSVDFQSVKGKSICEKFVEDPFHFPYGI